MEIQIQNAIPVKYIISAYCKDDETLTISTSYGAFKLSKAGAERLRNHLVEFLGEATKDDLLLMAMENGGAFYSPETGIIDFSQKDDDEHGN